MRWMRLALLGLGMVTMASASCQSSNPRFEPPKLREEYILPPQDDPRFSNPPVYPKEAMDAGNLKKDTKVNEKFGGQGMQGMGKGAPTSSSGGF
jgi:hypothetical protein